MAVKTIDMKKHYFTEKLNTAMNHVIDAPFSLIEAPMGFGKTTAVKSFLTKKKLKYYWHYVHEYSYLALWNGVCDLIDRIDENIGFELRQLGFPMDEVLRRETLKLLDQIVLKEPVYLVFDDIHLVDSEPVNALIDCIARRAYTHLHLVLISRYTGLQSLEELKLKDMVHHVKKDAFEFSANDIIAYSKACHLAISQEQAEHLESYTEGWISSIYLLLMQYANEGVYGNPTSIYNLIESAIFNGFSDEIQSFLKCMCLSQSFTLEQATFMWNGKNPSGLLKEIIKKNAFITYSREEKMYHMHNLFSTFLKELVENESDIKLIFKKCAEWAMVERHYWEAMLFYVKALDYDGVLSALEEDYGVSIQGDRKESFIAMLENCPQEVWMQHSKALLIYGINLVTFNAFDLFERNCMRIMTIIESGIIRDEKELRQLQGEFELLMSFTRFNDAQAMGEHQLKAIELVYRPIGFISALGGGCSFGSPSIFNLFYREKGSVDRLIQVLHESFPNYHKLTNGHGMGSNHLFEAEAYLMKGNFKEAEIVGQRAYIEAMKGNQSDMIVAAQFIHMRLAFYKGDFIKAKNEIEKMRALMVFKHDYDLAHTIDLCEGALYAMLDSPENIAQWILNDAFNFSMLNFPVVSYANIVKGRILISQKSYSKLIGMGGLFIETADVFQNLFAKIYTYLFNAIAYHQIYKTKEAQESLMLAIDMAQDDHLIMPFVENYQWIQPILDQMKLGTSTQKFVDHVKLQGVHMVDLINDVKSRYFNEKIISLTQREKEIASLAIKGLTNKEIADQLFISANTVKSTLKIVFEKQGIKSRALLKNPV